MTGTDSLIPQGTPSVLGATPGVTEDARAYAVNGGYRTATGAAELLDRIAAAGLRGRGGAGY
ncbi:NADH-ubiquinone oxidoreductase-F iron-sulfur binding region domain-containing protein, partial [Streptomyces decoyicus]